MHEDLAQTVLLVRAFEEADPEGRVLTREQRAIATRRAVTVTASDSPSGRFARPESHRNHETIVRRARVLRNVLTRKVPALRRVVETARLHSLMGPVIGAVALLLGLSTNLVGPAGRINLLSFPILALLAWNLGSYALMLGLSFVRPWYRRRRRLTAEVDAQGADSPGQDRLVHGLAGWVVRFALWRSRLGLKKMATQLPELAHITSRAFTRFCGLWHRTTMPLLESRVRRRLHLAAVAMILGVVAGMYLRGVALEYRATWESTWLTTAQVQRVLNVVLGPAASLMGTEVPDVAPLKAPANGPAAIWLHLFAISALVFVAVPRLVLGLFEVWRTMALKGNLPVDLGEGYYRRILADWRGETRQIDIVPYSFTPPHKTLGHLKTLLHDFFGTRTDIQLRHSVGYGEEASTIQGDFRESVDHGSVDERYVVVLFNLAQSPEIEVHGQFLEQLKAQIDSRVRLLVVIDVSSYKNHVGQPDRWRERLAAWERVTRSAGLVAVDLDSDRTTSDMGFADNRMAAVRAALWSASEVVETN